MLLLEDKNAVIYGAAGAVGSAVARAFAREGAHVFLAGRTASTLEALTTEIRAAGGRADFAVVDALDESAVESFVTSVVQQAGSIDTSFNAIGLEDDQGLPLIEMAHERFALPVSIALTSHFYTANAATRYMAPEGSGVIMAITANAARTAQANIGGFGVACAAIEGFCRQLAAEVGRHGIRVVCLRSSGSPDAPGVSEVLDQHAARAGISRQEFEARFAASTLLKRLPLLAEVANVAVLMASDLASPITGAVANVTCGELVD
jgi:NAD(P)-dependent dehydrogenase (short-subunit alcohol dehydrogenase family)